MDVLGAGRDLAESLMVDAGELRGPDARGPLDPTTGQYPTVPGALKYAGKAKAQVADYSLGNDAQAGERTVMVARFEIHLPISAPAAEVDDVWTFTACAHDPQLVGRRFRVASLMHKSFPTARRVAVEETQS